MKPRFTQHLIEQFEHLLTRKERTFAHLRWGVKGSPPKNSHEIETILHMEFSEILSFETSIVEKLESSMREFTHTGRMPKRQPSTGSHTTAYKYTQDNATLLPISNSIITQDVFAQINSLIEEKYKSLSAEQRVADVVDNSGAALIVNTQILSVSQRVNALLIREIHEHPHTIYTLSSRDFEHLIRELFSGFDYEVELTKQTRDGGVDVVAIKHNEVHVKYLIECKHPRQGAKIGVGPVRELYGVKEMVGASKAILATSSFFTEDAQILFNQHEWELEARDFDGIMDWVASYVKTLD